jgi:hypothetical protein
MRKYYKLTEAGRRKPWTDSRNWKILSERKFSES